MTAEIGEASHGLEINRPIIYVERLSNPSEAPASNGRIFGIIFAVLTNAGFVDFFVLVTNTVR